MVAQKWIALSLNDTLKSNFDIIPGANSDTIEVINKVVKRWKLAF